MLKQNLKWKKTLMFAIIGTLFTQIAQADILSKFQQGIELYEKAQKGNQALVKKTQEKSNVNQNFEELCAVNIFKQPEYLGNDKEKLERRTRLLCYENYATFFDPMTKTPLWVYEKVDKDVNVKRVDNFTPDPNLNPLMQASLADYRNSKFDRGHMAPAADMRNEKAMAQSFYMTNMVPQVGPNMNRGIWADLESTVRAIANKEGPIYVITGPAFINEGKAIPTIGKSKVWVPTHLYKIIYRPKSNQVMAYMMPNKQIVTRKTKTLDGGNGAYPQTTAEQAINCNGKPCSSEDFRINYKDIEKAISFKFF